MEVKCQVAGYLWETHPIIDLVIGIKMLELHVNDVRDIMNNDGFSLAVFKAEKVPQPVVKMDISEDDYMYFETK